MKHKSILTIIIAAAFMCLSFAGCGNSAAQQTEVNQEIATRESTTQESTTQETSTQETATQEAAEGEFS